MKKLKTNPTVTIGITAWNEEKNITRCLSSILRQDQKEYIIKKILVISDGSQDQTARYAQSVNDKRIKVINGRSNLGYTKRRNQLIKNADTDILVTIDADEELVDPLAISKLISEFQSPNVALVSGNPFFADIKGFVMRCQLASFNLYNNFRYKINDGHNIYGCSGGMMALRKEFYSKLAIPGDVMADDTYTYLTCISRGYKFKNARHAKIAHYVYSDLKSHIKRNKRYARTENDLQKYFSRKLIAKERHIPRKLYCAEALKSIVKNPIYSLAIFFINKL